MKKVVSNVFIQSALLVGFLVLDLVLLGISVDLGKGDWPTWFGAIGTVGTFIGTIWLSIAGERRKRSDDLRKAFVIASGLSVELLRIVKELADLQAFKKGPAYRGEELAQEILSVDNLVVPTSDLAALTVIPGDAAFRLASAINEWEAHKRLVRQQTEQLKGRPATLSQQIVPWLRRVDLIHKKFNFVHLRFLEIADTRASHPRDDENTYPMRSSDDGN